MCPIAKQVALGALLLLFSSGSAAQAQQGPARPSTKNAIDGWSGRFQPPGVDGTVYATAQIGDKVYVGGDFTEAGGVAARDLAVWDRNTKTWSGTALELDPSAVSDDSVAALTVGPKDSLYVGGHFEPKNSTSTNIVALKDETVSGYSGGLTNGSAGRGSVQALLNHQGTLYATGEINDAAGAAPRGFVRRTGGQWEVPGALANEDGSTGMGYALEIDLQGRIAIGGRFDEILQKPGSTRNIAAWDPAADDWVAYGEGLRGGQGTTGAVYALTLHTHQERQTQYLYAGGKFSVSAQSSSLNNVAFLGGSGWESATGGTNGPVYTLQGGGGVLRVGGDFTKVGNGSTNAHDIAVLSTSWQAWGGGTGRDSDVSSVRTLLRDGSDTFVGGEFVLAGPPGKRARRKANGLTLWDGQWTALGRGIERGSTTGVDAIVEGPGGSIFVGGLFTYAGGKPVRNVARWDGSQWHSLEGGLDHLVSSLAIDGNTLYVGGTFTNARNGTTDVTVNYVARWDGSQWSSLGGGMDDRVFALRFDSGTLYAGGEFTSPGQKLAQWDGSTWSPVGGGTNGNVSALATHDGALYVGGVFSQAGGTSVSDIARWDGNSWSAVGGGVANPSGSYHGVEDLAVSPFGELFVGGQFTKAGNTAVSHVARWFKGRWFPLGSGTDSPVEEVDFAGECQFYAGGFFSNAGGSPAGNVAAWNGAHWTAFAEEFKGGGVTAVRTTTRGLMVGGDFRALVNQDGTQKASSGVALWGGGFPGGSPSAALSLFSPSEDTLYYAAPESLRVDLSGASGIDSVDIVFSMDGGSSWETAAQGVKVKNDTASTVWEVPNRTSASKVILRVRSSTNPCLFAEKTYEYFHSQNAGKRVTHIYRFPNETEFFDPDLHGYPFENDSAGVWPKPVRPDYSNRSGYFRTVTQADPSYFPSWEIFCDAAGDAFCYFPAPQLVGVKWPRQNAALIWRAIASGGFRGACAGFAVTSFLAFENNQTVLNDLGIPSNGFVHDVSASQGRRPVAKYFTRELTLATVQKALSNAPKTPTETLNEVRAMLAQPPGSGRELKDLAIWTLGKPRSEINFNDLEEVSNLEPMGHVVTPYRVERDPSNPDRWSIYVYDNNHAGADQARIIVNTAKNSWTFPDVWAPDPGYSGTGKFAGLFLVEDVTNYLGTRPPKQKQSKARPASAGATGRLSSEWSRNRALLDTHVRMLNTQGTHLTIRDGSDRSIGYEQGILVNDMRGSAMPLLLRTGRPQPPIGFVVPENRTYEVEASNFAQKNFVFSVEEAQATYAFQRTEASPAETDRYAYGASGFAVTNPDGSVKTYQARAIFPEPEQERAFKLKKLEVAPSEGDYLRINRSDSTLLVTNQGDSTGFDLDLRRLDADRGRATYVHHDVPLPADARILIAPDWPGLPDEPVQVAIDRGMDDTVDEILSLPNQEGQVFSTADAGLTGVRFGSSSTGDVNGDGNRDLLLTGEISGASASSTLYLGEGDGNFTSASAGLTGVSSSSSNIADLNEDGSADLLISGETANGAPLTRLYLGDGTGAFSVAEAGLTNVSISASAIADFDEDGHPDIFVTGLLAGGDKSAKLYLGDGTGGFSAAGAGIEGTSRGSASVADVDGDGHVDLLVTGENGNAWSAILYLGTGDGSFVRAEAGLTGVLESSSAIGDVDRDGHPDLLITGRTEKGNHVATLYLGEGAGEFTVAEADLHGVDTGSSAIRDVDGDGVPDVVITGRNAQDNKTASLYLGRGDATFSKAGAGLIGVLGSSTTVGDFDGDRDTDLLVTGHDEAFEPSARLYKRLGRGSSPVASAERSVESSGTVGFSGTGVSISFAGTAGSGTVTVEKFDEGPADLGGINRQNVSSYRYEITAGGNLSFDENTELRLDAGTLRGVSDPTAVTIYRRAEDGPSSFTALKTTYDAGSGEVVASVGDFSTFALGSGSQPLPVELTRLSANYRRDEVLLKWQTASETNNAGFEVQRKSQTEGNWQIVGFVESKAPGGSTTEPRSYQYTDRDLPYAADSLTYRLKQVDPGGGARLTDEITIERDVNEVQLLSTYPNPARTQTTVRYALPEKQEVSIRLYDMLGRQVRTVVRADQSGRHERRLDVGSLPSGVYFLRLQTDRQMRTQKLTVVR